MHWILDKHHWVMFMVTGFLLVGILIMVSTLRFHFVNQVEASISVHHTSMVAVVEDLITK